MQFHSPRPLRILTAAAVTLLFLATARAQTNPALPTLWLIGDSTVKNGSKGLSGWGEQIGALFDPAKIIVQNRALGGRSSRTYLTEGLWGKVEAQIKPGDFVLMQFGHNDSGVIGGEFAPGRPARASIKGIGEDSQVVEVGTSGSTETVHTYGWYLRQYIEGAKAKGATPIVLSPIPRDDWKDGKVLRNNHGTYGEWAAQVAKAEGVPFIDLNGIIADRYDQLGQDKVKSFFPFEHTHTNVTGAQLNAECVVQGIKSLADCPLRNDISPNADTAFPAPSFPPAGAPSPSP